MGTTNTDVNSKRFIDEINHRQPNAKISIADRDFASLLAGRDRRTEKYGITISENFVDYGGWAQASSYRDNRYMVSHEKMHMSHTINFKKNNKLLYEHKSDLIHAEMDIIDLVDTSKLPSEAYICPNCGKTTSTEELASSGCPFCGTRFSIPQLYPKVSYFSHTEGRSDLNNEVWSRIKKPIIIAWIICYIPLFILGLSATEFGFLATLIAEIGLALVACIPVYFIYAILTYGFSLNTMFSDKIQRDQKRSAEKKTSFANEVFEKAMAKYGPVFNFQYFSSRVYNLLGAMIYAEDKNECPFYSGPDFIGRFDNIIDYVPIGMQIKSYKIDEKGKCTIGAIVMAVTYSYVNGKILHRKSEFTLNASKNMNYPIDINFSAHTYKCDGCSASYDVTKSPACPYCGRPHDLLDEEWYIDGEVLVEHKRYSI